GELAAGIEALDLVGGGMIHAPEQEDHCGTDAPEGTRGHCVLFSLTSARYFGRLLGVVEALSRGALSRCGCETRAFAPRPRDGCLDRARAAKQRITGLREAREKRKQRLHLAQRPRDAPA